MLSPRTNQAAIRPSAALPKWRASDCDRRESDAHHEDLTVGQGRMPGHLGLPENCQSLVLFGYAGKSISTRALVIVNILVAAGFGILTLGFQKDRTTPRRSSVDVENLAGRLIDALDWIAGRPDLAGLRSGVIIGGLGAAAVLQVAGRRPGRIHAIVAYGGRVDLVADEQLAGVTAPTLLIVGGGDPQLESINRRALPRLNGKRRLEVLPRARYDLEGPGDLKSAGHLAAEWFVRALRP